MYAVAQAVKGQLAAWILVPFEKGAEALNRQRIGKLLWAKR